MTQRTRTIEDTKAPDGAFFIGRVNKFGSAVVIPANGLDIDFSPLPPTLADGLEIPVHLRALGEALTGEDFGADEPMPHQLRRRAEEIRAGLWPDLPLDLAAAVEVVRHCHLHQRAPTGKRRAWLKGHSPELLAYLDSIAADGSAKWRTVADRWHVQASAMALVGIKPTGRNPRYEHMLRALKEMAAIGAIALKAAEEDERAEWELARKQLAAELGLKPTNDEDQGGGGGAEGGSGGGQKSRPGEQAEDIPADEAPILSAEDIAELGWGPKKSPATPVKETEEPSPDYTPPGGFRP